MKKIPNRVKFYPKEGGRLSYKRCLASLWRDSTLIISLEGMCVPKLDSVLMIGISGGERGIRGVQNRASPGCVLAPWVQSLNSSSLSQESSIIRSPKGDTVAFLFLRRSWDWRWAKRVLQVAVTYGCGLCNDYMRSVGF